MSSTIALAVDVSADKSTGYRSMARRSRAVQIVDGDSACDALITDNTELAANCAAAGKHVLMIDPFGLSSEMRANLASTRTMPGRSARFQASIRQVKRALDDGKLGEPGLLRIHDWREASRAGNDTLARELDLAVWIFGSRPTEVYAVERTGYVQAHLGFDQGGMAIIDIDASLPPGNEYYSLSLIGSSGAAYADDHHNMNLLLGSQGTSARRTPQGDVALAEMIETFVDGVGVGRDFSPDWSETELALRVAEDVRSAASEQRVVIVGGDDV